MFLKSLIIFLVIFGCLLYFTLAFQNRQKVELNIFHHKIKTSLGFLIFSAFLDGIIAVILIRL